MTKAVLHKGNLAVCVVCNPDLRGREKREKKVKAEKPADYFLRRQVNEEGGEDATRDERLQLLEKYGVSAPKIDRRIKRPNWMGVQEWKERVQKWFTMTKGLVPAAQEPKAPRPSLSQQKRQHAQNPKRFQKPQYRRNK